MKTVLGLDIGGANTKYVLLSEKGEIVASGSEYFPFWQKVNYFPDFLQELKEKLEENNQTIDCLAFVTTAELADCFVTKKEGIDFICQSILEIFSGCENKPVIYSITNEFILASQASNHWLNVSASNWHSSANFLAQKYENSIFIDIGSTTTDIIPIFKHEVVAQGSNDLERLATQELVYSGLLRTNVAALVQELKVQNKIVPISSELFTTTADVYLVLEMINEEDVTVETANGKPATIDYAKTRLARVVCADRNQLSDKDIREIALQIKDKQLQRLSYAFNSILSNYRDQYQVNPTIIITGSGAKSLGILLLRESGIYEQIIIDDLFNKEISNTFAAYAVAQLFLQVVQQEKVPK